MQLTYTDPTETSIKAELDAGETLGSHTGPAVIFVPTDPANKEYQAILASGEPIAPFRPSTAGAVAQSAQARSFSDARTLNAQGRTQEAVTAILDLMEQRI